MAEQRNANSKAADSKGGWGKSLIAFVVQIVAIVITFVFISLGQGAGQYVHKTMPKASAAEAVILFGLYFLLAALVTAIIFAPSRVLTNPRVAKMIGTPNVRVVRGFCIVGAFILWVFFPWIFLTYLT